MNGYESSPNGLKKLVGEVLVVNAIASHLKSKDYKIRKKRTTVRVMRNGNE